MTSRVILSIQALAACLVSAAKADDSWRYSKPAGNGMVVVPCPRTSADLPHRPNCKWTFLIAYPPSTKWTGLGGEYTTAELAGRAMESYRSSFTKWQYIGPVCDCAYLESSTLQRKPQPAKTTPPTANEQEKEDKTATVAEGLGMYGWEAWKAKYDEIKRVTESAKGEQGLAEYKDSLEEAAERAQGLARAMELATGGALDELGRQFEAATRDTDAATARIRDQMARRARSGGGDVEAPARIRQGSSVAELQNELTRVRSDLRDSRALSRAAKDKHHDAEIDLEYAQKDEESKMHHARTSTAGYERASWERLAAEARLKATRAQSAMQEARTAINEESQRTAMLQQREAELQSALNQVSQPESSPMPVSTSGPKNNISATETTSRQLSIPKSIFHKSSASKFQSETFETVKQAAQAGNASAASWIGSQYIDGRIVAQDPAEAMSWFRTAAEAAEPWAMQNLARFYAHGITVAKDDAAAAEWNRRAFDEFVNRANNRNDLEAIECVADCYAGGLGVARDTATAVTWLQRAADAGQSGAMFKLGSCCWIGMGVSKDQSKAVKLWLKAADAGHVDAMIQLALCLVNGQGTGEDWRKGVQWMQTSAAAGNARAMSFLGMLYKLGYTVSKDREQSVEWYRKAFTAYAAAAEQDDPEATFCLGLLYEEGDGVAQDRGKAAELFAKAVGLAARAAEFGEPSAMRLLGQAYNWGKGVARDEVRGREWTRKAVLYRDVDAQRQLDSP